MHRTATRAKAKRLPFAAAFLIRTFLTTVFLTATLGAGQARRATCGASFAPARSTGDAGEPSLSTECELANAQRSTPTRDSESR